MHITGKLYTTDHKTTHIFEGAYTPAKSSPVRSSQIHEDAAVTLGLTYNGHSSSACTPAERVKSNPVQSDS